MELDLSLENKEIYAGVKIESYGGKKSFELNPGNLNLTIPPRSPRPSGRRTGGR